MDIPIDPNVGAAAVYLVISYIYLRPYHGLGCRITLAIAAAILGLCAACKSDFVRNFEFLYTPPSVSRVVDRPAAAYEEAAEGRCVYRSADQP
jgi:hypothetical protein